MNSYIDENSELTDQEYRRVTLEAIQKELDVMNVEPAFLIYNWLESGKLKLEDFYQETIL